MNGCYQLLVGLFCLLGSTQLLAQPILTIESEDAAVGTELCLDITGDDFDNIFGFQFTVDYDASVLDFTSSSSEILGGAPVNISNPNPGEIRVQWSIFAIEGYTNFDPFLIGTMCFNVLSDEETFVRFSSSGISAEVTGQSGQISDVVYNDGVVNEGNLATPNDLVFNFGNGQIVPGQTVCQSVTVAEFNDIADFEFTISNPLGAVATPMLQNAHPSLTGTLGITGSNTAIISYDHGGGGVTLADGLVAFDICHDIPGNYTDPNAKTITEGAAGSANTAGGTMIGTDILSGTASPPTMNSDDFIFNLTDGEGAVAATVCLDVTVNAFESVGAFQFSINYDAGVLQFQNFDNLAFPTINASQPSGSPGQIRVSWVYNDPDNLGETLPDGSTLLSVCFRVLVDSETDVVFSNTPILIEAFDNNLTPFNVLTDDGTINAGSSGGPSCNDGIQNGTETGVDCGGNCAPCNPGGGDLTFSLSDESGNVGQQVCLDLTTENHEDILAWQFSINFDTDFIAYTNFTMNPAYPNSGSEIDVVNSAEGVLRVIWSDQTPQFDGFTFADGTVLATFCFTVVDDGPTTVDITNSPILITAANDMGQELPVSTNDGSVNGGVTATCNDGVQNGTETGVDCGGNCSPCVSCNNGIQDGNETGVDCGGPDCAPCNPGTGDELTFSMGNGSGGIGSQVCLNVTTTNFEVITAFQFSVNYDPSFLTYESFTSNQTFTDNFSPVQVNDDGNGNIRIIWIDQTQAFQGLSLTDGATVLTLCFTVLDDEQTAVSISGSPISITASDNMGESVDVLVSGGVVNGSGQPTCGDGVQNGQETGVDCGGPDCAACPTGNTCSDGVQNGQETGVDCGGPDCMPCNDNLTFDLINVSCDDQICMELITSGFTDITAFQFSINFDETVLSYESFTSDQAFADAFSPVQVTNSAPGVLRVIWVDQTMDFAGLTFQDGTPIISFCFAFTGTEPSTIMITDNPITITASDNTGSSVMPIDVSGGTVTCGMAEPTCNDGMQNGNETGIDCGGPDCDPCITCDDGIQNGQETGIDCGGPDCAACPSGATCDDGVQNGQETGVDCGGPDCTPCNSNLTFDLINVSCDDQICMELITSGFTDITAFQFSINFDETVLSYESFTSDQAFADAFSPVQVTNSAPGVLRVIWVDQTMDFEGLTFQDGTPIISFCFAFTGTEPSTIMITDNPITITASDNTGASVMPIDVSAGTVTCGMAEPTCNDGMQNGNETGIDCGGPDCDPCITCDDGIQNGQETGVDCGGPDCMPCMSEPTCDDGMQNGQETGVDCGGPDCDPCNTNLTFDLIDVECDDQVCMQLITSGFTDITAFQFSINFDESVLSYENFTSNQDFADIFSPVQVTNSAPGVLRVIWVDQTMDFNGLTFADGETILTFCFAFSGTSNTVIQITDDPITITASDNTGTSVTPIETSNGTVTCGGGEPTCDDGIQNGLETGVDCGGPDCPECPPTCDDGIQNGQETGVDCGGPDCPECPPTCDDGVQNGQETGVDCGGPDCPACPETNVTFSLTNGSGSAGTEVCLDVNAFDFTEITDFQFSLSYDPMLLQFSSATGNMQLPGLMATSVSPGQISVTWDGSAVSLANGSSVLEVCFQVLEACTTPINFTGIPTSIEANNADLDEVTVNTNNGTINAGLPCTDPPANLVLDIGDGNGGIGSEVCLDITVDNFDELTELQFSITYADTVLTYNGATNFNLAGLSGANISNPSPGVLTFNWSSPTPAGETLADGSVMVSICFIVDAFQETVVQPSNNPTAIIASNANGQSVGVVPSAGIVNTGAIDPGDALTFIIGSGMGDVDDIVCVPVTVFNLELAGFQFGIAYDENVLEFIEAVVPSCPTSGGPVFDCVPGFSVNNINDSSPGALRVFWDSPDASNREVADGSEVFELCFRILQPECASISFSSEQIAVQFFNQDLMFIPATLINGAINCSGAPMIVDADVQSPSCLGDTDGSISLNVVGGANLTYSWTPNVGNGPTVEDLPPGIYTVVVTNPSTNESTSMTYTVNAPPAFSIGTANVTDVRCNGENNGSITIVTNGGTGPFTIDWSGSLQDGVLQQNNLTEGFYSVTVTDGNGCSREIIDIEIEEPDILIASGSITNISVGSDGSIDLLVTGGTPDYDYQWSGPNSFSANTEDINGLTDPGSYCVTVTDSRGCTRAQCFNVSEMSCSLSFLPPTIIESGCFGESSGFIDITVGCCEQGDCLYIWTNSEGDTIAMTEDLEGLDPGTYSVIVTRAGDMISSNFTLTPPSPIEVTGEATVADEGDNGTITIMPANGVPPYSFAWTEGINGDTIATSQNLENLAPGEYCVFVQDQTGCATQACFTVEEQMIPLSIVSSNTVNALCADSFGLVEIILANGSAPYTAVAEPGGTTITSNSDTVLMNLPAGTYDVTVTDDEGQEITATMLTIEQPTAIVLGGSTVVSDTEDANCSGSITLEISGGTPDYTISWNQMGLSGPQLMELCAGTYTPTITDANGCVLTVGDFEVGLLTEEATTTEVACPGDATGGIDLTVAGGQDPYSFVWTEAGNPDPIAMTEDLEDVPVGTYTVVITDATGANLVRTYEVTAANGFFVTTSVTSNYNGFNVSCANGSDASLEATVSGTGTYTYEWRRNGNLVGTEPNLFNVPAGEYTLTVTSDQNCIIAQTLEVTEPNPLEIVANITDASCEDARDGRIELNVSGGAGGYEYFWENGRTTPTISFLLPDRYSVEVSDANNCFTTSTFTVESPEALTATASATDATEGCNGSVRVEVVGGNGNYTYEWPQLSGQSEPTAENLCPGEYMIVVRDGGGCQSVTVTITVRDRRFPCLSVREVITPNGDGLNESFILFCTDADGFGDNTLEIFNRWGQLVFTVDNYDCSQDGGSNCFIGQNNDGAELPEGPYYYVLDYANPSGDRQQLRGSLTILRE